MRAYDNPRVEWAQQSGREFGELPGGKPKRELVLLLFGAKHFQDHFYEVFEFRLTNATGHAGIVAGDAPGAIGRPHFLVDIDRRQAEQPWRRIFVPALLVQSVHLDGNVPQLARRIGLEPGSIRVNWSAVGHRENVDGAVAVALSARAAAGEQNCLEAWLLGFQPGDDANRALARDDLRPATSPGRNVIGAAAVIVRGKADSGNGQVYVDEW